MSNVSLILPTYNEAENIHRVLSSLYWMPFEDIIVVDDNSPDNTAEIAREFSPVVTTIIRTENRGLAPSVREGIGYTSSEYIMVADADGQHTTRDILAMVFLLKCYSDLDLDVIIGSRFIEGSEIVGLSPTRTIISKLFNTLCNLRARTKCSDPMTGLCIIRRDLLARTKTRGFKFLYEILLNEGPLNVVEWPITFESRGGGVSKANVKEVLNLVRTPKWTLY